MATNKPRTEAKDTTEKAREKAGEVVDKTQQQAEEVAQRARDQAKSAVSQQKERAATELHSIAQAFRQTGSRLRQENKETVAHYSERMADQVDSLSNYMSRHDVDQFVRDAENAIRRQPELVLGGAFAAGLLLSRFLKSSSKQDQGGIRGYDPRGDFRRDYERAGRYQTTERYPTTAGQPSVRRDYTYGQGEARTETGERPEWRERHGDTTD